MNIILIKPYWAYPYSKGDYTYNRIWPPLSLANCAAVLEEEGHNVKVLDAHAQRIVPDRISSLTRGYDKIFITSSSLDKWQCPNIDISTFLETVKHIRRFTEEVYVMGYHGTVEPEKILNLTSAKAIIRGEPEYTVTETCEKKDLLGVNGVSFKSNGRFISNLDRAPSDLRTLPVPAYHLLDINKYFYEILGKNFVLFEISRGCNYRCNFCNKIMYREGLRIKSIEQIIEEVKTAIEKYKVKTGYFIDLDFLSDRDIARQLCEYLIRRRYKFRWTCQTRPDLLDIEILKLMKKAGCQIIHMGIETGLQASLDYLNKGITLDRIEQTVNLCKKADMKIFAFFLFGLPKETAEDREETFNFAKKLNTDFVSFHKMLSYKGSNIYKDNLIINGNLDKFIRRIFLKYYLRFTYWQRLDPTTILRCLRLFYGRIKTL